MSFGWSVGDLAQAASLAWTVYESCGDGLRSAKSEFATFKAEFNLVKVALEKLATTASEDELGFGDTYHETLAECRCFIEQHARLTKDAPTAPESRRAIIQAKLSSAWEQVSWPLEREKAEQLRKSLERYVQIAILKVTANTRDVTRQLIRMSHQTRMDNLELLKAIRTMSVQVSSILRRCLPEGSNDEPALDVQYLATLQRRQLQSLLDPWPNLVPIPESDERPPSSSQGSQGSQNSQNSQEALDRIQELKAKLAHLTMRLDTLGGGLKKDSSERPRPITRTDTSATGSTLVAPVVGLLNHVSDEVRDALERVGYDHVSVPSQQSSAQYHGATKPSKALNNAAEEWEQFHEWLQFQLVHTLDLNQENQLELELDSIFSPGPDPKPTLLPPAPVSPRQSHRKLLSPPQPLLGQDEQSAQMVRTSSSESTHPGSPAPSSTGSTSDRGFSMQPESVTRHSVQLFFPDPERHGRQLHRPVSCQVVVSFHRHTPEPERIESFDAESGLKITHWLPRQQHASHVESSMTPYVPHSRYLGGFSRYSLRFIGSHRLFIEKNGQVTQQHNIAPIYVCQNKEDFEMFQSVLLRRQVIFCGNVTRIHSGGFDHCDLETVRVLRDQFTGAVSILYFASNRGSKCPKAFVEWPVSDFEVPRKAGKRDVKLQANRNTAKRRGSMESTGTSLSHESRASSLSWTERTRKMKSLQFDFDRAEDSEAFIKALQSQPRDKVR